MKNLIPVILVCFLNLAGSVTASPDQASLLKMLHSSKVDDKIEALRGLAKVQQPQQTIRDPVIRSLEDKDKRVRIEACHTLRAWGPHLETCTRMIEYLKREGDAGVKHVMNEDMKVVCGGY